jgi:hypothetical protein
MKNNCICLERIGDNGPCPQHGAEVASGAVPGSPRSEPWIDVRERVPAGNDEVLGIIAQADSRVIDIVVHDERDGCWTRAADQLDEVPVSHWMPLPELPGSVEAPA